ncbi:MAG: hypothetical protein LBT82_01245 [Oscillospiraceae bacterium]|jgi:hypothetical protein|nr:hypothetical protein [Oscillospiraceae bacterium]
MKKKGLKLKKCLLLATSISFASFVGLSSVSTISYAETTKEKEFTVTKLSNEKKKDEKKSSEPAKKEDKSNVKDKASDKKSDKGGKGGGKDVPKTGFISGSINPFICSSCILPVGLVLSKFFAKKENLKMLGNF